MRRNYRVLLAGSVLLIGAAGLGARQGDEPVLSPPAQASCSFPDGKSVQIRYSSPRMKGRKIFGGLVPYGEVWRAGANEATSFTVNTPVTVQQQPVPAGSYTIFTLPELDKWTLILSKQTGEWGIPYPGQRFDFARVGMKVAKLPSKMENFTIAFDKPAGVCTMRLEWETTAASVDIAEKK